MIENNQLYSLNYLKYFSLLLLTLFSIILSLTYGAVDISLTELSQCVFSECKKNIHSIILWQIRLPRVLVGLVAGAGLACAGAILQNISRNPLADPYLFGIISGAGLGATIATLLFPNDHTITLPLAAFLGSLCSVFIVFGIATLLKTMQHLILTGVAVSFMLGAITHFLLYLGDPYASNRVIFWLMGSLAQAEMLHFYMMSIVMFFVLLFIYAMHRQIDALLLGDDNAQSLGVEVNKLRITLLIMCAAMTAVIVAYCGGIGFVGLMIPHIVRHLLGVTTLPLIIGSTLVGSTFLLWVDMIARTMLNDIEIPVGIITSAIGSIFFLLIMFNARGKN